MEELLIPYEHDHVLAQVEITAHLHERPTLRPRIREEETPTTELHFSVTVTHTSGIRERECVVLFTTTETCTRHDHSHDLLLRLQDHLVTDAKLEGVEQGGERTLTQDLQQCYPADAELLLLLLLVFFT
jgi:hypothetical protein